MSKYQDYDLDQTEELLSNFLIDSWSYSKVTSFARNEKAFEMENIYGEKSKRSASSVAGNAYHSALELYFLELRNGKEISIEELQNDAFTYINEVGANQWKLQKTTPTVEECIIKATKASSTLIANFYKERSIYTDEIAEVIDVEMHLDSWLTINGVDIPLPCHAVVDLLVKTKDGKIVIIDHKSKASYTDDKDLKFTGGKQAITYIKSVEANTDLTVDEVWFIENKVSKNKDKSPQLKKFKIVLDDDTRRLYEALLYEPLKRMVEAVSDANYVYMVNDNDNFADKAELYDFWAKTLIAETDDFNIADDKKELVGKRQKKIRDATMAGISPKVISEFKKNAAEFITYNLNYSNMTNKEKIEHVLRTFGVIVKVAHEIDGYSSNTYLLEVSVGVKIANVMRYKLDIANALNVPNIRIGNDLMVYEGKSYLYIETAKKRERDLLWDKKYLDGEKLPLGVDNFGRVVRWDLNNHSTPHMLICGATGSGKSVSILSTISYAKEVGISDITVFDPKFEFVRLKKQGIKVISEINEIEAEMKKLVDEMHNRARSGEDAKKLIIFDEFADAVSSARSGRDLDIKKMVKVGNFKPSKEDPFGSDKLALKVVGREKSLEENLKILLQKGRSLGYRIISATQRASTKIITGDAKVNFPVQICFRVPKEIDSKVVLDDSGAETLAGMGDGLIHSPEYFDLVRFQGFFKK